MKRLLALQLVVFILFSSSCKAEEWETRNKWIGGAALALHIADWRQTRYITEHPQIYREMNPLLGPHPSKAEVDRFFLLTGIGTYLIADYLQGDTRTTFLSVFSVLKFSAVYNNYSIGIKLEF